MYQRDYIMRMIEQLGVFLTRILKLKEAEKFDAARMEIDRAGKTLLGLDMSLIRALSDEKIISLLQPTGSLDSGKCLLIAELLREEGDICERQGKEEERYTCYSKSLSLYLEALAVNADFRNQEYLTKINALIQRLQQFTLLSHIDEKLFHYFEMTGEYAKAENHLFLLLETDHPEILEEGIRFYERLLAKSDRELEQGNLPREEVEEGLRVLQSRQSL